MAELLCAAGGGICLFAGLFALDLVKFDRAIGGFGWWTSTVARLAQRDADDVAEALLALLALVVLAFGAGMLVGLRVGRR